MLSFPALVIAMMLFTPLHFLIMVMDLFFQCNWHLKQQNYHRPKSASSMHMVRLQKTMIL